LSAEEEEQLEKEFASWTYERRDKNNRQEAEQEVRLQKMYEERMAELAISGSSARFGREDGLRATLRLLMCRASLGDDCW
jgi:hypothetical protein